MIVTIDTKKKMLSVGGEGATLVELAALEGWLIGIYGDGAWKVVPGIGSVYEIAVDCAEPVPVPDGERWSQTVCSA